MYSRAKRLLGSRGSEITRAAAFARGWKATDTLPDTARCYGLTNARISRGED